MKTSKMVFPIIIALILTLTVLDNCYLFAQTHQLKKRTITSIPQTIQSESAVSKDSVSESERMGELARQFYQQQQGEPTSGVMVQEDGGETAKTSEIRERYFTGVASGDDFGYSVSNAGDVNGDGYSDIIVGAPFNDAGGTYSGQVYIYFGGTDIDNVADVIFTGAANGRLGYCVSSAGDVNRDGYNDVIVGEPYNDAAGIDAGRVYIYFGGVSMDSTADVILTGSTEGDYFGISVSSAGDVNADGYGDVIVGAYHNDAGGTNAGQAYLYYGGASMDNVADVIFTGAATGDYFGYSVSSAGDVDGNGYGDVIIGAHLNDAGGVGAGRAYIYFGGTSMNNVADVIMTGTATEDGFGYSVSNAGDVNGDGYTDVIIGAPFNEAGGNNAGQTYLYHGGAIMDDIADQIFTGVASGDNFGFSVSSAGDVNGDGYSDLFVGAPNNDAGGINAGRMYLYHGGASMDDVADRIFTGVAAGDVFGYSISSVGDVNGDGYHDLFVGAPSNDAGGSNAGRAYLYLTGTDIAHVFFTGVASYNHFGKSVSSAGDVNGDGYSDVVVGAPQGVGSGLAYLYYGGTDMDNVADLIFTGAAGMDVFGFSVSSAGDVNGDGFSDVIVGAPQNDIGGTDAGQAYLYFGGASMDNVADLVFTGVAAGNLFGWSLSNAGDVNGDGYSDVIIGANYNDAGGTSAGQAYLYYGGTSMDNVADLIFTGVASYNYFGESVSSAGDVNGDGYSDVIIGAWGNDAGGANAGQVYLYYGGVSMNNVADVVFTGAAAGDCFGYSVSSAGDVNKDEFSDVIIGALANDAGGINAGRVYLYYGGASMNIGADVILTGAAVDERFGATVSSAGDVNGDGYSDVVVGASFLGSGQAFIYFGGASMDSVADAIFTGAATNDYFGGSVSGAGDVNGDGYCDVLVGAPDNDAGGTDAGRVYLYINSPDGFDNGYEFLTGTDPGDHFGYSVSTAGDVNGDGYDDMIVGAYLNDAGGTDAGRAYLYFGGVSIDHVADLIFTGAATNDRFGCSVSSAGDVNGDGYSDVIIGAFGNDAGGADAGRVYLYFGGASMNNVADLIFTGAVAYDAFGISISGAGDVNGDEYSDIIIGAYANDAGGNNAGQAYLYFGGASMDNNADLVFTGTMAEDYFGVSVSSAGDVNGDEYGDVLIGANYNDAGGTSAGQAYLYFGGASMDNNADLIFTGAAAGNLFGASVSGAGDVNGDKYADVIIGATGNNEGGTAAGRAYLYFGGTSMDNIADLNFTGVAAYDLFGNSVSSAGDVNADGYSDVIIGAYTNDAAGADAGQMYLFIGGANMDDTVDVIHTGDAAGDWFGSSVSGVGDVNGDGYSDVIVGTPKNDAGGSDAGKAYLYLSSPTLLPTMMTIGMLDRWNMISVPLTVEDYTKTVLYPTAISSAFAYEGTYIEKTTLANGVGYWIKFSGDQDISLTGFVRREESVNVQEGWNMVGSLSEAIDVSQIGSVPGGIVTSEFFGYAGSYSVSDTIYPGKAYWVKVSQSGTLMLGVPSAILAAASYGYIRIVPTSELPPPPPEEVISTTTELPTVYALYQNYPNPFNPVTVIHYQIPAAGWVSLKVYNLIGQEVAALVNEKKEAGKYNVEFDGSILPSGVYFYRIKASSFIETKKLLLLK